MKESILFIVFVGIVVRSRCGRAKGLLSETTRNSVGSRRGRRDGEDRAAGEVK